jgi:hypothetical protein
MVSYPLVPAGHPKRYSLQTGGKGRNSSVRRPGMRWEGELVNISMYMYTCYTFKYPMTRVKIAPIQGLFASTYRE